MTDTRNSDVLEADIGRMVLKRGKANQDSKVEFRDYTNAEYKSSSSAADLSSALTNAVLGAAEKCAKQLEEDGDELVKMAQARRDENYKAAAAMRECAKERAEANSAFIESLKASAELGNQIAEKFLPTPDSVTPSEGRRLYDPVDAVSKTA